MKLEVGDDVICVAHPEMGVGKVCFFWTNGYIDVNYPEGKKLTNWPQEDFEGSPQTINTLEDEA